MAGTTTAIQPECFQSLIFLKLNFQEGGGYVLGGFVYDNADFTGSIETMFLNGTTALDFFSIRAISPISQ